VVGYRVLLRYALSWFFVAGAVAGAYAQVADRSSTTKVQSGTTVQPVFEGWERNPDGTFNMWFGYFNRNWSEELNVPVGPNNNIEPGGPDRGQPEIFQTGEQKRRQMFAFKVVLPADWSKDRDVIWTLTTHGTTLTAYGSLWPVEIIDEGVIAANRGSQRDTDPLEKNQPPTITEAPKDQSIPLGKVLPLVVSVIDDGRPKPARPAGTRGPDLKSLLRVTWIQWRGPGVVKFDPEVVPVTDAQGHISATGGSTTTKATFDKPGIYTLKAYAEDMSLFTMHEMKVTVTGGTAREH
jgi:hypothetical protein